MLRPGSSWSRNQSRSWAKESGRGPVARHRHDGGRSRRRARPAADASARPATVGPSNRARSGSSTPNASRSRETSWVASSEWPPSSKKLSCDADPLHAQHLRPQIPASSSSVAACAAPRSAVASAPRRLGRRQRPAVDLAVGRQRQRVEQLTKADGHHVRPAGARAGRRAAPRQRRSRSGGARRHVGDQARVPPARRAHATTTARRTAGCARSAASISPSSMRKPRIFTWWSMRPRNSSVPSARSAGEVAGAVEPAARLGRERVGDEALGGQLRAAAGSRAPGPRRRCTARPARRAAPARSCRSST